MNSMHRAAVAIASGMLLWLMAATTQAQNDGNAFDWVAQTVNENFYDPKFNGVDWAAVQAKYRQRAAKAASLEQRAAIINEMLAELRTSHTQFYTPDTPEYFQLLGLFLPANDWLKKDTAKILTDGKARYDGIGLFTIVVDGKHFVRGVLHGLPAQQGGILLGDRIVAVNGEAFHPIASFKDKAGKKVSVTVERAAGVEQALTVIPASLDGSTMFIEAMKASVEVVAHGTKKIGYIHAWSYAGKVYQEILEQELLFGRLKEADALVLDVRDGLGGASPSNLNIFTQRCLAWTSKPREGEADTYGSCWSKPVVLLIDQGSRSGKELLAYAFKRGRVGTIVGTRTAGAVVAGTIFANETDASLLYLATNDVTLDDGTRLEGVGVQPDIAVPVSIEFTNGRDLQKERAISEAARLSQG